MLLATAACNFSTSQLQKVLRECCVLYILTWKCASRHSGVQFFNISTSKSAPNPSVFLTFLLEHVRLATAACNFSTSQLQNVQNTAFSDHFLKLRFFEVIVTMTLRGEVVLTLNREMGNCIYNFPILETN